MNNPSIEQVTGDFEIYCIAVGLGNATFIVTPTGEVILLDTGPRRVTERIKAFMEHVGIKQIDYLVITHFEEDHMGAAADLIDSVPVRHVVDHGNSVVYGKGEDFWKARRGFNYREGMGEEDDRRFDRYCTAREKTKHIIVQAGDTIPVSGLQAHVVSASGKLIQSPMIGAKGAGMDIPKELRPEMRSHDELEDGQSVGLILSFGEFRFAYFADLSWNLINQLFSPVNLIGNVDAYIVTHHAQSYSMKKGENFEGRSFYEGRTSCSKAELYGLSPRVAVLSLGGHGHRKEKATSEAIENVWAAPRLENLWQTEFIYDGAEKDHNAEEPYIAFMNKPMDNVPYIRLSAKSDGSFTVSNSRNGYSKHYSKLE